MIGSLNILSTQVTYTVTHTTNYPPTHMTRHNNSITHTHMNELIITHQTQDTVGRQEAVKVNGERYSQVTHFRPVLCKAHLQGVAFLNASSIIT